jgi:LysR family transcriptional regulator, hydrogen peroxide-inducible genes activator
MAWLPTLRQLEYAVAVADHRHFRRAAAACAVSQPALSTQIRELEDQLGVRLFERGRGGVVVTPEGGRIAEQARAILASARELVDVGRSLGRPLAGPLRLGVIPTVAPYLLPKVLPGLQGVYPDLSLLLREDQTARLVERLAAGELDVLLLALEANLGDSVQLPLFRDRFQLVVRRDHALARRRRVRESDLEGSELLLLDDGHCLRDQTLSACQARGARERANFRATSLGTLTQMVASGIAATLLPELALASEVAPRADLVAVPFERPEPHRTIGLVWRRGSARTAQYRLLAAHLVPPDERPRARRRA